LVRSYEREANKGFCELFRLLEERAKFGEDSTSSGQTSKQSRKKAEEKNKTDIISLYSSMRIKRRRTLACGC